VNPVALAFGSLELVDFKTAKFNAEGHAKARAACNALMRAMPDVDWQALSRKEDAQIAEMGSLAAAKWRNVAIAAVVVLALIIALKALA
jgi:ABC-type Fe3+-siderophore transport system permease subunit